MSPTARAVSVAVAVVAGLEGLGALGALQPAENALRDRLRARAAPEGDLPVVLVAVDDASLEKLPDPILSWGPHFATAIARLRAEGATAIGLDFELAVGLEDWLARNGFADSPASRTWDAGLRAQLHQGDVVLAASIGEDALDLPLESFLVALPDLPGHVGLTAIPLDPDGVARRFRPVLGTDPARPGLSFALLLALRHAGLPADAPGWTLAGRPIVRDGSTVEVTWLGPPGTVPRVPFWQLVEAGALDPAGAALLRGRVAVIGSTWHGSSDTFLTPHLRVDARTMPGSEVQANLVATLLGGERVAPAGAVTRVASVLAGALAVGLACFHAPLRAASASLVLLAAAWAVAAPLAAARGVLLPAAEGLLAALATFAASFPLRFVQEVRERARIRGLFRRHVAPEVVDALLRAPEGLGLGGARRELTVLVTDIRGFTTLAERLTPEETVELLNAWFEPACRPILRGGGVVDKFLGDGILAVFGAPVARPDHARRALVAAIEMAEAARVFSAWVDRRFAGRDLPPFGVGVGVHTGEAVAGNIGFELRTEYTVIGDTVNTASRIESLTRVVGCTVLASRRAVEAAGAGVRTGRVAELPVKGKALPVEVVEVLGVETA